jgi:SAM-dependent methyltransferase
VRKSTVTKKSKKEISREIGLEVGSVCGRYFLKLDHLHFGYWTDGIEVDIANLHKAQDAYAEFILSNIPTGVKTILDVGCGTGQMSKILLDRGYQVDCVSPSSYLNSQVKALLGDKSQIFECFFQDLQTENRYDLVLFCESFQYIDLEPAFSNTVKFLKDNGHLLICDYFKKAVEGKSAMGGGHKLTKFYDIIQKFPLRLVRDLDITDKTAPNMDLVSDVLEKVVRPVVAAGVNLSISRHPTMVKILKWKFKKQIDKLRGKYFCGGRTGEDFKKFKSYRLFLYQKMAD